MQRASEHARVFDYAGSYGDSLSASVRMAFRVNDRVGTPDQFTYAAQWLACSLPCRRFAATLTSDCARLGADVDRYSFIAADLHRLLSAGLPAHIAVGTPVTERPPHRSRRARFAHRAPTQGV